MSPPRDESERNTAIYRRQVSQQERPVGLSARTPEGVNRDCRPKIIDISLIIDLIIIMVRNRTALRNKGVVLIMVLGILALLSVLGTIFCILAVMERGVAKVSVDMVRARLAARSGVERAVAELQLYALSNAYSDPLKNEWVYFGEDINRNSILDPGEDANGNGILDIASFPLDFRDESKIYPSFKVTGKDFSGQLPGTYNDEGDIYLLKILDCSSMININTPYKLNLPDQTETLARILENLSKEIDPANPPIKQGEGQKIINYRKNLPQECFVFKDQIKDVPGGIISDDDFQKIKDYITVYSWLDSKTIRLDNGAVRPAINSNQVGRPNYGTAYNSLIEYILVEPRSPININIAAKPVLVAVLSDLKGIYYEGLIEYYGTVREAKIDFATAEKIADEIIVNRRATRASGDPSYKGAFASWSQFNSFCDNYLVTKGIITAAQAGLLKANFNPNTDLNKNNPNASFNRIMDRFDITAYSTEFCFGPTGYFEITSVGRIKSNSKGPDGKARILAESKIESLVKIFDLWRNTTQSDFSKGEISSSTDDTINTPHDKSLQTYPEPDVSVNGQKLPEQCFFDGQIMLATLDAPNKDKQYLSRAGFTDSLNLTEAKGKPDCYPDKSGPIVSSVISPKQLGDLYPDGCYIEKEKVPGYLAAANVAPGSGSISFWIKPNWKITDTHMFISMSLPPPPYTGGATQIFSFLYYGASYESYRQCLAFQFEGDWDWNQRMIAYNDVYNFFANQNAHKWVHVAITWNAFDMGYWPGAHRIYLNGQWLSNCQSRYPYGGGGVNDLTAYSNLLRLGERGSPSPYTAGVVTPDAYPEGTMDEVTVYPNMEGDAFIMSLYRYGRYYPVGDAAFTSGPISSTALDSGTKVKLGTIAWTEYNPFSDSASAFEFSIVKNKTASGSYTNPTGNSINMEVDKTYPFSYRFTCKTAGAPLFDTPVIDDVTITMVGSPSFFIWKIN